MRLTVHSSSGPLANLWIRNTSLLAYWRVSYLERFSILMYYAMGFLDIVAGVRTKRSIKLLVLVCIIYCIQASSEEFGTCDEIEKYIAKSYFDKHSSLVDSEFEDYIAHGIPLGFSEVMHARLDDLPRVSALSRTLDGEGSHRRLSSSIRLKSESETISKLTSLSCYATIIERLPSGVFADPFELQHLVQRGVLTRAAVYGDTNLELPSFRSNRSLVEIHLCLGSIKSGYKDEVEMHIQLPLHARYQPLGHGFSRVKFGLPDLFLCCSTDAKGPINKRCFPMPIEHSIASQTSEIVWDIPCGNKEHAGIVSSVTFVSAVISALFIVLTCVFYPNDRVGNDLKRS